MKAIINEKLYDTEKSELLFSYRRKYKGNELFWKPGYCWCSWADVDIYKTEKGNYFLKVIEEDWNKEYLEAIAEEKVKEIIKKLDVKKYIKLFGKVEEA